MTWSSNKLAILSALAFGSVFAADEPFSFCKDAQCGDCPVSVASAGSGFPECVIYNTADFFAGGDFPSSEGGGFEPFLDVVQPDPKCKTIVKSPAETSQLGCGTIIGSFSSSTCSVLPLKKTFMVQTCCGDDDCSSAGTPWKRSTSAGSVSGGMYLKYANGTVIEPAARGQPDPQGKIGRSAHTGPLSKRDTCEKNSWVADAGMESYTRPADGGQVVYSGLGDGQEVTIKTERSVSYTQTIGAEFGFADILSFGVSMETSMTETMTEGTDRMFSAKEGQTGKVIFTPFLKCSTGSVTCEDGDLHGEVCTGYKNPAGEIEGLYSVAVTS